MIVSDAIPVNTGSKNGIIIRLQKEFEQKSLIRLQYVGCQNHALDLILRHLVDFTVPTMSPKPSLNYEFIDDLVKNYENLQKTYKGEMALHAMQNPDWRDDFKFLFEMCELISFTRVLAHSQTLSGENSLHFTVLDGILEQHLY